MVAPVGRRPTGYVQRGKHRWRMTGGYAVPQGSYAIYVCMVCGVRVDTRAPFPDRGTTEKWNGQVIGAKKARPPCLTQVDDGVQSRQEVNSG